MNSIIRGCLPALGTLVFATSAMAQVSSTGLITGIRTGWGDDLFAAVLNVPVLNPAGCASPDGYISHVSLPGYHTFYSAALSAYEKGRPVTVVVNSTQCVAGRPTILGINF
jgi:hypothetical protein